MKKLFAVTLALLMCLSAAALAAPTEDRAGNPIQLPEQMSKIVSLAPSITMELVDLGLEDALAAVDTYSAGYMPQLAGLPQFDMMAPDVEQLAAMIPDAIFISGMSLAQGDNPYQQLIDMGIPVVEVPSSDSIAGIQQDVMFIGECVGKADEAAALVDEMAAQIDAVAAIGATIAEDDRKTVAIEVSALPYLYYAGGGTYLNEMIALIGAVNAYADADPWAYTTEEDAVAANPDVILTTISYLDDPVGEILSREGWGEVAAIANGEVYQLDEETANQPNHRVVKALWQMAQCVYPEAFAEVMPAA